VGKDEPKNLAAERATVLQEKDDDDELPVVARLVVEIRSDGRRTVARGALEDRTTGQTVAVQARGSTPWSLALGLARSLVRLPSLGRATARALLPGRKRKR